MIEEWKELDNYSAYLVSNTGKVKNKATGELRPQTVNGGFWCTNLVRDDGVKELSKVHRLVAIAFVPNPEESYFVCQYGDKLDASAKNQYWKVKKVKPEPVVKEEQMVEHLGKTYTLTAFSSLTRQGVERNRNRLKLGWTSIECIQGYRNFTGQGYIYADCWFPTKESMNKQIALDEEVKKFKLKEDRNKENALKRAIKKAKVHHGFGIFTNYPIVGIEGRKPRRVYYVWQGIIARCYNPEHDSYDRYGGRGCTVNEKWKYFQDFAVWYEEQQKRGMGNAHVNWHVDKDILFDGNLEYGPDTCCFVPDDVNTFFAGIHKDIKGCSFIKGQWRSSICIFGNKHQRGFNSEQEARDWYLQGKSQAAKLLLWKYGTLIEDRVINKLSKI